MFYVVCLMFNLEDLQELMTLHTNQVAWGRYVIVLVTLN